MMSDFVFSLADVEDDFELREILEKVVIPGKISVSFRREPSFFEACKIQGRQHQVIKCTEKISGRIVGLGSRVVYPAFVNGERCEMGYLGDLRIEEAYRNKRILSKGYAFLRQLHEQEPVPFYITMIWEGNELAQKILTSGKAGLPHYHPMGNYLSPAIFLNSSKPRINVDGISFERGKNEQIEAILDFINACHQHKQFASFYCVDDFDNGRLHGLQAKDFFLAMKGDEIVGVLAVWDQMNFRQTHVEKYSSMMRLAKPFYNFFAVVLGKHPLLAEGEQVPFFYISHIAIKNGDKAIMSALLRHVYLEMSNTKFHYFICGFHESDPLVEVLKEYRAIQAGGKLYCVCFEKNEEQLGMLGGSIPYIEAATL